MHHHYPLKRRYVLWIFFFISPAIQLSSAVAVDDDD
jgi:hypothetical protein